MGRRVTAMGRSGSLVSVVIPTHDRRERLRRAVRSVLAQRGVDLQVIVVDDGSTDGTEAMIEGIVDPRIRLVRHEVAVGESGARNRGIAEAEGDWVAFLDDDDLWAPDKLERQLEALGATGRAWAYGGEVVVDEELRVLAGSPPPDPVVVVAQLRRYNAVPGSASSVLVASALLARVGSFDVELRRTPDWDMWLRLAGEGLPASVDRPIVAISVHAGNVSRDMGTLFAELEEVAARHGIDVDRARHHRWAAWTSLVAGERVGAFRRYVAAAAAGDPTSLARAFAVLVPVPGWPARRRQRSDHDPWRDEAEAWLEVFKAGPTELLSFVE